jgi:peroxiredoxin
LSAVFYLSYAALWVLVLFQTLVLLGLVRIQDQSVRPSIGERPVIDGPTVGRHIPSFAAIDLAGEPFDEQQLLGRDSALLFVSPDCATCTATLAEVEALGSKTHGNVVIVCRADAASCDQLSRSYGLSVPMIVDEDLQVSTLFNVGVTPSAVLVGADGVVRDYGHPMHAEDLLALISESGQLESSREVSH